MRPKKISDFKLLELASEVIIEYGPEAFTLRKIAKHAKVSPATLIKRFKSRDALLTKCISQHLSKISNYRPEEKMNLEGFIKAHSKDHKKDNIIQNISLLARDMREPSLKKVTSNYFDNFRKSLSIVLEHDKRFSHVDNCLELSMQIEVILNGAIIQGAFVKGTTINKNIEMRLSEFVKMKYGLSLNWT